MAWSHPIPFQVRIREHHTNPCVHEKPRRRDPWGVGCNGYTSGVINKPLQHTISHTIHGTGIFTYIWLIYMVNVGKYTIHDIFTSHFPCTPKSCPFHISCWYQKTFDSNHKLPISVWCVGHSESVRPSNHHVIFPVLLCCKCVNNKKIQPELTTLIVNCDLNKNNNDFKTPSNQRVLKMRAMLSQKICVPRCALVHPLFHELHPGRFTWNLQIQKKHPNVHSLTLPFFRINDSNQQTQNAQNLTDQPHLQ